MEILLLFLIATPCALIFNLFVHLRMFFQIYFYLTCALFLIGIYFSFKNKKILFQCWQFWCVLLILLIYTSIDIGYTQINKYPSGNLKSKIQIGFGTRQTSLLFDFLKPDESSAAGKMKEYYENGRIKFQGYFDGPLITTNSHIDTGYDNYINYRRWLLTDEGKLKCEGYGPNNPPEFYMCPYGKHIWWSVDGKVFDQWEFNEKWPISGQRTTYYENGQKQSIFNYKYGRLSGPSTLWNPQGIVIEERVYDYSLRTRKTYFDSGKLKSNEIYKNDILLPSSVIWFENSRKKMERTGSVDGKNIITIWYDNGNKKSETHYVGLEKKTSEFIWDSTGKIHPKITNTQKTNRFEPRMKQKIPWY
jgi:antitoxin component YwqK of YwqJK toxin-antitoxin module